MVGDNRPLPLHQVAVYGKSNTHDAERVPAHELGDVWRDRPVKPKDRTLDETDRKQDQKPSKDEQTQR